MELADLLIVNKADGPLLPVARRTKVTFEVGGLTFFFFLFSESAWWAV